MTDFYETARAILTEEEWPPHAPIFVAYVHEEDRFYLLSKDQDLALPMPPDMHAFLGELTAEPDRRLGCHPGFVPWPLK